MQRENIILKMIVIGITGTLGAGKGTIVEYLKKRGFTHYSVREFIAEEVKKRSIEVNRDSLTAVANDLRAMHGPSYIIEKLYEQAALSGKKYIIESLRAVGEVEALRKKGDFLLVAVDADPRIRYERIVSRKSETDRVTFEKFLSDEKREMESDDSNKQNLGRCIAMADWRFMNDGSIEELERDVERYLSDTLAILG